MKKRGDTMAKTGKGLVTYAKAQLGKPYWYGTYGQKSTKALYESKKRQYPTYYEWALPSNQLGVKVHDCIGLVKGYLWSDSVSDPNPKYNAKQDVSANRMLDLCKIKGGISSIPEIAGTLVFMEGHVGVYIGGGYVIEARGHAYGVVKTKLQGRGWKRWGLCPWITYEKKEPTKPSKPSGKQPYNGKLPNPTLKVGSKGIAVQELQRFLNWYGKYKLVIDGIYGVKTEKAVKDFQRAEGIKIDGIYGAQTRAKARTVTR